MSRHVWSAENTFKLIKLYEENAPLWDTKHTDYRNREVKGKIINHIAIRMNVTTEEIIRKLHNLRNQVSQELNKLKKKTGSSSDETPTSNWPYFSALRFLIPSVINRSRNSNITIQQMEERECDQGNTKSEIEDKETFERKREERRGRKRPAKSLDINNDQLSKHLLRVPSKISNEDDRFGEWVALELRSLCSEVNRRKLKSEIRKAICRIADLDAGISVPNTSSNLSPPSPIYMPVCEIINVKSENT